MCPIPSSKLIFFMERLTVLCDKCEETGLKSETPIIYSSNTPNRSLFTASV